MKDIKPNKNILLSWWFWLFACIIFLLIVHILFSIPAPYKWLEAVWGAGDLISFSGTIILGFVAWKQSKMANDISEKLIRLQTDEYIPVIALKSFIGITKFGGQSFVNDMKSGIVLVEMHTTDGETILDYAVSLVDDVLRNDKPIFCRTYELHFKYLGKPVISKPIISTISFIGHEFEKSYTLNESIGLSLMNDDEFRLWIQLISNFDFMDENTSMNKLVKCREVSLGFDIETASHIKYHETLRISKHFVTKADAAIDFENTERLLSVLYETNEIK